MFKSFDQGGLPVGIWRINNNVSYDVNIMCIKYI